VTPAIDRVDVETPIRAHAKSGDTAFVSQTVNRVRMNAQKFRDFMDSLRDAGIL
jgi:hypothetical protein